MELNCVRGIGRDRGNIFLVILFVIKVDSFLVDDKNLIGVEGYYFED